MIQRHAPLFALLLCFGCFDGPVKTPPPIPENHTSAAVLTPVIDGARALGRHEISSDGALRFAWSGAGLTARFSGTGFALLHKGPRLRYSLTVDGKEQPDVFFDEGSHRVVLAQGLKNEVHVISLTRQGEALFGPSQVSNLEVLDGKLLDSPAAPTRRIEIYGDSISCGYGNEGEDVHCGFSAETENHKRSYGAILARALSAELSTIAWSGRGVVRNYAGEKAPTLVDLAMRSIPQDENSIWSFPAEAAAQAVIINLGTNDYSTAPDPSDVAFIEQYDRLLSVIRQNYPDAFILCTVGPLLSGSDLETARKNIALAVSRRNQAGDTKLVSYEMQTLNEKPGCDWHPGLATHQTMADELLPLIKNALNW